MTRRWLVLAVLCLAELVVVLDNTVLNVAVPVLATDLRADTAGVQWTINAYALAQAGLLLAAGSAADRYGRRRMLLLGLAIFGAGSLAAGFAGSVAQLVAARAVMGAGGALLITGTLAVAIQVFDATERPRAIAIWAAVNALGFAAGPLVGGLVLAHLRWGAIFLVNVPLVLAGLAAVRALVPESRSAGGGRPDVAGAALATLGTTAIVYAIIAVEPAAAIAGVLTLVGFLRWERYTGHPMLDPALLRSRRFVGAVTGVLLITFGSAGALFLLTMQLQFVRGYSPLEAGLHVAPFALTVVALTATGAGPRLIHVSGLPLAIAVGMTLLAAGLAVVALAGPGYGGLLTGLILMGAGCAVANPAIVEAVVGAIPADDAGAGAGVEGTMTELGTSLGVAVLGTLMHARFTALQPTAGPLPAALTTAPPAAERHAVLDAFAAALALGQGVGAGAVLAGGWLAALLLRRANA
ncbi:MFS transporter [Dactylosporangium matsuzakiense]|uniref:MFS transporter n=1 Tax=Dactylosporangium matsuzakiense TaxID=53360 RepID=UPI0021C3446F|nr:MFS transporter [Dactylosporangium matsuzakiense]UWZ42612.1 MFS transporter [Dactylosporangium matsuzakiense]